MATKCLFRTGIATPTRWSTGLMPSWYQTGRTRYELLPMLTTQGAASNGSSVSSVAGPTAGVELGLNQDVIAWITPPFAAATTISGSITFNLWASEPNMSANAAINARLFVWDPDANTLTEVHRTARTTEVAITTATVNNWSETPTSFTVPKGGRLLVSVLFDDAGTMGAGYLCQFDYNGPAGANGDSYISFTENFSFDETDPTGTTIYPTTTASSVDQGTTEREAWTSRGGVGTNAQVTTTAGPTSGIPLTDEWYTKPLQAFTLSGPILVNQRARESASTVNAAMRCEIAVVDGDGSNAVVYGTGGWGGASGNGGELSTTETAAIYYVTGADIAVADGQRIRIRFYADDAYVSTAGGVLVAGGTVTLVYNGPTAGAVGDTFLTFGQTLAEFAEGTPKTGSDTGTGTDTATLTVVNPPTEAATGADVSAQAFAAAVADAGTGTDAGQVLVPKAASDTATGVDASALTAATQPADTGTGADVVAVSGKQVTEQSATANDASTLSAAQVRAETGAGTDTSAVSVPKQASDAGAGVDTSAMSAQPSVAETGAATDAPAALVAAHSRAETGAGTEVAISTASYTATDAGTGVDASTLTQGAVNLQVAEAATGADTAAQSANYTGTDTAGAADASALQATAPVQDAATAAEVSILSTTNTRTDSATGVDMAVLQTDNAKNVTDSATGTDTSLMSAALQASNPATGSDVAAQTATHVRADTGAGADAGTLAQALVGAESGAATDSGVPSASLPGVEVGTGTDTRVLTAALLAFDLGSGADAGTFAITALDLHVSDSGTWQETAALAADFAVGDTATGTDTASKTELAAQVGLLRMVPGTWHVWSNPPTSTPEDNPTHSTGPVARKDWH